MSNATFFVVDDDDSITKLVEQTLSTIAKIEYVDSIHKFLDQYNSLTIGCIIIGTGSHDPNGLGIQQRLVDEKIPIPVIFVCRNPSVEDAVRAMKLGALDFFDFPVDTGKLRMSVEAAIELDERRAADQGRVEALTPRERQIADLLVEGMSSKQIGTYLGITHKTVNLHRTNLMKKLDLESTTELVRLLERVGRAGRQTK